MEISPTDPLKLAHQALSLGLVPIPVKYEWSPIRFTGKITKETALQYVEQYIRLATGVAILTGEKSKVVVLKVPFICFDKWKDLLSTHAPGYFDVDPPLPWWLPSGGGTLVVYGPEESLEYYFRLDDRTEKLFGVNTSIGVSVLPKGAKTIFPGSLHSSGKVGVILSDEPEESDVIGAMPEWLSRWIEEHSV